MGGCRCTFRSCDNSSGTKPGMHFFHFPIRDWPRLEMWAYYAGKPDFKDLPMNKLKNKVVCQEHFHNRMFMNYLRESLTKTAVPTLEPLSDGQVLDLETNEIGLPEEWVENESVCVGEQKDSMEEEEETLLVPLESDNSRMEIQFLDSDRNHIETAQHKYAQPRSSQPVLLNAVSNSPQTTAAIPQTTTFLRRVVVKRKKTQIQSPPQPVKILHIQKLETTNEQKVESPSKKVVALQTPTDEQQSSTSLIPSSSTDVAPQVVPTPAPSAPPPPPATVVQIQKIPTPFTDPAYLERVDKNTQQIEELKKLLKDVLNRPIPDPKIIKVPVPTPVAAASSAPSHTEDCCSPKPGEKGPHMNKVQLFNGIKRYLNPTMVALLRMEMFGGSTERQWKPDEKTLAVELIGLGENVYDHFCDEFRFRLPAKKDVQKWKEQELDDDDAS